MRSRNDHIALIRGKRQNHPRTVFYRPLPARLTVLVIWILIAFAGPCATSSAQNETDAVKDLEASAEKRLDKIHQTEQNISELSARIKVSKGEDRQALEHFLIGRRVGLLDDIHELAQDLQRLEALDAEAAALRAKVELLLDRATNIIPGLVSSLKAETAELRDIRGAASPEERRSIAERISLYLDQMDQLYLSFLDIAEMRETLGLSTEEDRRYLLDELTARAGLLVGRIELNVEHRDRLRELSKRLPDDGATNTELAEADDRLAENVSHLHATVSLLKRLDADTTSYQAALVSTTGELSPDVLDKDVAAGLLTELVKTARQWIVRNGPAMLFNVLLFVVIILLSWVAAHLLRRLVARSLDTARIPVSRLLHGMLLKMTSRVVLVLGVLFAFSQLGVSIGPFLAGLGIAGFILGFALQDTLSNFAAGMMILLYQPFDVDDVVEAGGAFGRVSHMSLVSTTIMTFDNQTLVLPNSKIWGDTIKNVTVQKTRRVDLVFGISYDDDIPRAERVLAEIVRDHPKVLVDPAPVIRLHALGESSVDFIVRPWCASEDFWEVHWDITREVKLRFDREGINIPYPQRDVHLHPAAAKQASPTEA